MDLCTMLADISAREVGIGIAWLIGMGIVLGLILFGVGYVEKQGLMPAPIGNVIRVVLVLLAIVVLINFVLWIFGHPFINW